LLPDPEEAGDEQLELELEKNLAEELEEALLEGAV
jgi:hypothetical protein